MVASGRLKGAGAIGVRAGKVADKYKVAKHFDRPAYNSEMHATRDIGVGELNNCYEDAELADTIASSTRGGQRRSQRARRRPATTRCCTSPSSPAPTWCCSTRC